MPLIVREFLQNAARQNPAFAARWGSHCLVSGDDRRACRQVLESGLLTNRRSQSIRLDLANLMEADGNLDGAERIYAQLLADDQTFWPLWEYWNYRYRSARGPDFEHLSLRVIRMAPAGFRGHFPLLLSSGEDPTTIMAAITHVGSDRQRSDFLDFLVETANSSSGELLQQRIRESQDSRTRQQALRFIGRCIQERARLPEASAVWSVLVESGAIADRRTNPGQDAALNPNPRFRLPLVPRSFDWSVVQNESASSVALDQAGGLHIRFTNDLRERLVLVSKLIVPSPPARWLRVSGQLSAIPTYRAGGLYWELRNAETDAYAGELEVRCRQQQRPACDFDQQLSLSLEPEPVFLLLVLKTGADRLPRPEDILVREITLREEVIVEE